MSDARGESRAGRAPYRVGVIGAADGRDLDHRRAEQLGAAIAERGWLLICGGLGGVMEWASRGAAENGGVVVGILPGPDATEANRWVQVPIATAMGHARNVIIAHSADVLVAIGGVYGTLSEAAIGLKLGKRVFALSPFVELPGAVICRSVDEVLVGLDAEYSTRAPID
ncbi:MAG: TIGR00725 family protein [Myxococcales bacterium]|nr:TIGR00725 family protein [Myxococcales bacterium]